MESSLKILRFFHCDLKKNKKDLWFRNPGNKLPVLLGLPTTILVRAVRAEGWPGHLANWPPYKLLLLMAPRSMPDTLGLS